MTRCHAAALSRKKRKMTTNCAAHRKGGWERYLTLRERQRKRRRDRERERERGRERAGKRKRNRKREKERYEIEREGKEEILL